MAANLLIPPALPIDQQFVFRQVEQELQSVSTQLTALQQQLTTLVTALKQAKIIV